jgi:hypothetical protein
LALLCLGAGLTASAAGSASAATGTLTTTTHTASALVKSAPATLTITNPGTQQTEPDTASTLDIRYSYSGGSGVTQAFSATGLPSGLSIDSSTGVISGTTSSTIASYDVTVSDTDSAGDTATVSFTWNVWNKITVASLSGGQFYWEQPATVQVGASDSASGATLTYNASGLPAGMSINSSTGVISGTPTSVGSGAMVVTVTDGTGSSGTGAFGWDVASEVSFGLVPGSWTSIAGQTSNLSIGATSTPPEPLTYQASGLPPGVTTDGPDFVGWPTTPGTYDVTDAVNAPYNAFTAAQFPWTVTAAPDSGPNGQVHLNLADKCLDDSGNSSANGNKIQVWTCSSGDKAQKWTYAEDGTLRINGKCLDLVNKGTSAGTDLQLWSCTGASNQQWVPDTDAQLINPVSGLCLTDPGGSTANGTRLQIYACGPSTRREWTLPAGSVLSALSGRCLDDLSDSTADGAKVGAYTCNGTSAQKWTLEPDGTVRVNGKCLDDTGNSSTTGNKIQLWSCNGDAAQRWTVALSLGSLCASPTSLTAANGAQLVLESCGDESNWHTW